jgi:hypothetical protein
VEAGTSSCDDVEGSSGSSSGGLRFKIQTLCLCVFNILIKRRLGSQVVLGLICDK